MTQDFYNSDLVVKTYDLLTEQANRQISGDIAFYLGHAKRFGGPILELGVGTGRVAWKLAAAGCQVVGVDRSDGMLAAAGKNRGNYDGAVSERLRLVASDIVSFDIGEKFPLALIPFSTFQHLATPEQQRSCLNTTRRHLTDDARLILDLFDPVLDACIPGAESPNPTREAIDPETGNRYRRWGIARSNDPLSQTVTETSRFEMVDQSDRVVERQDATHTLRWATRQEMAYLFEVTGFEIEDQYSDFQRSKPTYGNRQIWVLKPA